LDFELIDVAGIKVELWQGGSGRPVIYLHSAAGLELEASFLSALAQRYQVFAPSHPGFGGSDLPQGFTSIDDLSYVCLDFIRKYGLADAVLLGVSLGAWIAAEVGTKCTHALAGIVLADALGVKFSDRTTRDIVDLFAAPAYAHGPLLYSDGRKLDYSGLPEETLLRLARNHSNFARLAWSPTLHNPRLRERLHRIDVPTQVLWGAEDRIVSVEYGRRFAEAIPDARFEVVDGAGHYVHLERTDRFMAVVNSFIGTLPPFDGGSLDP